MKEIINNSYLRIIYGDKTDIIKLTFKRDMNNSFLIFNGEKNIFGKTDSKRILNKEKALNYFKKNFEYNGDNSYVKEGKTNDYEYKVQYLSETSNLVITETRNNIQYLIEYNYDNYYLNCSSIKDKNNITFLYSYNIKDKVCVSENCDNELINHFLDDYLNIYVEK